MGWFGSSKKKGVVRGKITMPKPKPKAGEIGYGAVKKAKQQRKTLKQMLDEAGRI